MRWRSGGGGGVG
uniref:Uncharacterized protein n=1 Tax=Zea mays TaxID=4577 RepID=C4J7R4_MAIZE|nr:unknown [Zea mays]